MHADTNIQVTLDMIGLRHNTVLAVKRKLYGVRRSTHYFRLHLQCCAAQLQVSCCCTWYVPNILQYDDTEYIAGCLG